jgi:hypothetical protein
MESFGELVRSPGHWEFEIFLMVLFDGLIAGLVFPFVRKHWKHHIARDQAEAADGGYVFFSSSPDDDPEKWPDPGVERCMECLSPVQRLDNRVASCGQCGTTNPMTFGFENPEKP